MTRSEFHVRARKWIARLEEVVAESEDPEELVEAVDLLEVLREASGA